MAQPKNKMLDCWCQKQEALTMAVEFSRMRIAKIRNDIGYSRKNLNNRLGLINEKGGYDSTTNEAICWLETK